MLLRRPTVRHGRGVPNLVVARRVLHKMHRAAQASIEDETGEALVGLILDGSPPTVYVLDTISPDDSAVRQYHTFQQGDERQDELIWWLQENWRVNRERRQGLFGLGVGKWDAPLRYLGDWHKQPGYMIQPSGGDLMTALNWLDDPDNAMTALIAPIVTLDHPPTVDWDGMATNFVMLPTLAAHPTPHAADDDPDDLPGDARVDWWYIDRRTRLFQPITPQVTADADLPALAPYPWHLADPARTTRELAALDADGVFHSITLWNADGETPLEVCLLTARMGADRLILIVTPHDYPAHPPQARVTPFVQMAAGDDLYRAFERAWKASASLAVPAYNHTPDARLIDFLHAAEAAAGIVRPPAPLPPPDTSPALTTPSSPDTPPGGEGNRS